MSELDDDWFYDSIRMYESLYMYDLQQPATAMDWIDNGSRLCVAMSNGKKHELAEMTLPDKVLETDEETSGLIKDRDFRMINGGFCDYPVAAVEHVPNSRVVCTCSDQKGGSSDVVEFWQLGRDDTDLIEKISAVKNPNPKCDKSQVTSFPDGSRIVFGSHSDSICVVDVKSHKITNNSQDLKELEGSDLLSSIHVHDGSKIICCCQDNGNILLLDTREKLRLVSLSSNQHGLKAKCWTQDILKTKSVTYIIQLSSTGYVNVVDLRNLTSNVGCFDTELHQTDTTDFLRVKASQNNGEQFSISGFDSSVYVYSSDLVYKKGHGDKKLQPLFIHEGHVRNCSDQEKDVKVVTHLWHPWQPDLLLSAATDGSLHGWQYNKTWTVKS